MPTYQLLTDRTLAQSSAITPTTLIHIVYTGDPSQNIAGSSFKAELGQLAGLFSGGSVSGDYLPLSGGTVSGSTNFTNGLTANTISATTYLNLPLDIRVTGGTYSAGTATFTNNTGGTFNVTGFTTGTTSSVSGDYLPLSGGTVTGGTIFQSGLTANTISATTYQNLPLDIRVTGGTYSAGTATFTNNTGGTFNVTGFTTGTTTSVSGDYLPLSGGTVSGATNFTNGLTANTMSASTLFVNGVQITGDTYVTGLTFNTGNYNLTIGRNDGVTFTDNLGVLASDNTITGGTYNSLTGVGTFTNNTGGTFSVSGFLVGYTDVEVTGSTYNNNTFTFTNSTGGTFNVSFNTVTGLTSTGLISSNTISATTYQNLPPFVFTGGTVSGATNFTNGLSANTISATTYQNLPTDIRITGATYSNNTFTHTNNTGGTYSVLFNTVTGLTVNGNLTVDGTTLSNVISATTYQNLPTDIRVTGATYSNNTFTHRNNTGGTYTVLFNTVTGLTVNGTLTATTLSATTYQNLPTDIRVTGSTYTNNTFTSTNNTGGTYSVLFNTVTGLTVNGQLSVTGNTGLGTSSPSTKLDISSLNSSTSLGNILRFTDTDTAVTSNNQFNGKIEFYSSDTPGVGVKSYIGGVVSTTSQGSLIFGTTGATGSLSGATTVGERMRIDYSGYVGINDSTPSYRLEVSSGAESADEVVSHFRNDASKGLLFIPVANNDSFNFNTTSGDTVMVSTTGQPLVIGSKDGAAFRFSGAAAALSANTITTGNRLGIGSVFYSSTEQPSESLDVNGSARFRSIGSTASAGALHYTANGTLTTNTSDQRLKENIEPLTNSLSNILKLSGVTYNWIGIEGKRIGFIAQEVEKVIPELVFTNNNTEEKYKGIHQDNMVAVLVESIKEQQQMIEDLKVEITNLKLRITNLES